MSRARRQWIEGFARVATSIAVVHGLVACGGGVPADSVTKEASIIQKSATDALALHARCVDPDAGDARSALCAAELQAIGDIQNNAKELLRAAGASDAGTATGGDH